MAGSDELLQIAVKAARAAGSLLLERFGKPAAGVESKRTPTELVSDADRDAEKVILEVISRHRSDDSILSEEGGGESSRSDLEWVIDPLDGTINFLFGVPVWCVSIAVRDEKGAVAGVVFDPNRDETFSAIRGEGAALNGSEIYVTSRAELSSALIGTGFFYDERVRAQQAETLTRILPSVRDIRRPGSAAIDLSWLAVGRYDGFYEAPMEEWDKAAGALIVEEAGGVVSELPAPFDFSSGVIAAGPPLHDQLRALVLG